MTAPGSGAPARPVHHSLSRLRPQACPAHMWQGLQACWRLIPLCAACGLPSPCTLPFCTLPTAAAALGVPDERCSMPGFDSRTLTETWPELGGSFLAVVCCCWTAYCFKAPFESLTFLSLRPRRCGELCADSSIEGTAEAPLDENPVVVHQAPHAGAGVPAGLQQQKLSRSAQHSSSGHHGATPAPQ